MDIDTLMEKYDYETYNHYHMISHRIYIIPKVTTRTIWVGREISKRVLQHNVTIGNEFHNFITCTGCYNHRDGNCSDGGELWKCNKGVPISHEEKMKQKLEKLGFYKKQTVQSTLF